MNRAASPAPGPSHTTSPRPAATHWPSSSQVAGGSGGGSTSTMPRKSSQAIDESSPQSATVTSKAALPALASATGAIACDRNSPVRDAGAGAATSTRAAAPTSTVKLRALSASRSSSPSITTRPCRIPGSSPVISKSSWLPAPSFHVPGFMARLVARPSAPIISTVTVRLASVPTRLLATVSPSGAPAGSLSLESSTASMAKLRAAVAPTSTTSRLVSGCDAAMSSGGALSQAPREQSVNR